MSKDYYKILGVDRNATKADIKKAYKRLAKKYHPDLNKEADAGERFKEINEAASVLADEQKRAQYDQFGTTAEGFGHDFSDFDFREFFEDLGGFSSFDFGDVFDRFFSSGFRGRRPSRGADLLYNLEVELEDVAAGAAKHIRIPRMEQCRMCEGRGAESSSDIAECGKCRASGVLRQTRRTPFGIFSTTTTCDNCRGTGQIIKKACSACRGSGSVKKEREIKIELPKGIGSGMRLRLAGEGEAGERNAPSGDLFVNIYVKPHKIFQRKGDDIYMGFPISFATAALGGTIEIPTLYSKATLKIPAGTQTSTVFRLRGKGLPSMNSYGQGDQNVEVRVDIPKRLTRRQKELLEEFDKEAGETGWGRWF